MSSIKRPNPNENWCHEKPDAEVVKHYLKKWKDLRGGIENDIMLALDKLFTKYPKNNDLNQVRDKVSALNELYQAGLYIKINDASERIKKMEIDQCLEKADPTLVNKIAKVTNNAFSFASKYCCFHRPEHYPIFDSKVRIFLCHCNDNAKKWGQGQPQEKCFAFEPKNLFKGGKNDGEVRMTVHYWTIHATKISS